MGLTMGRQRRTPEREKHLMMLLRKLRQYAAHQECLPSVNGCTCGLDDLLHKVGMGLLEPQPPLRKNDDTPRT